MTCLKSFPIGIHNWIGFLFFLCYRMYIMVICSQLVGCIVLIQELLTVGQKAKI
jgi:hypothetical protein